VNTEKKPFIVDGSKEKKMVYPVADLHSLDLSIACASVFALLHGIKVMTGGKVIIILDHEDLHIS
jgi:hypothetical protein